MLVAQHCRHQLALDVVFLARIGSSCLGREGPVGEGTS